MTEPATPAVRTTRAERMTMPLARQVVKDLRSVRDFARKEWPLRGQSG